MVTVNDTIAAGKAWLRTRLDDGEQCPLCNQMAKMYKRKINATMARTLIRLHRVAGSDYAHAPSLPGDNHEISQLAWWGLVEEDGQPRPDGGRGGHWRVSDKGRAFIFQGLKVPKYAKIYDHKLYGLTGDPVTIQDALGSKFDLQELMRGA